MNPRSYAIIGTGALGGYYGALLHHAGRDVHFLLHSDYDHVRQHGLSVETTRGDRSIPSPHAYHAPRDMPRCDVALVALKTTQNHLFPEILPHVIKDEGVVLVMQNGLGAEDQVAEVVGGDRVLGGLAFLCSHKVGPGHIRQVDYGQVRLGHYAPDQRPRGLTPQLAAVAQDFRDIGVSVDVEDDLLLARWKKLVWNVPFNGLTVVLDTTTDRLMANPDTRALSVALMEEVAAGARACGRTIDAAFIAHMMDHTDKMVPYRPSMKLDYDERRAIEVEAIYGNPVRTAEARGARLPTITALYRQLKFLDLRNRGEARPA